MHAPEYILKKYWGYSSFRPLQKEIVTSILNQDTVAILPTGSGKSVCFQVPAIMKGGCTVVITPLISLMMDQVNSLISKGVSATYLASNLPLSERFQRLQMMKLNKYRLVYVSPEKFTSKSFLNYLINAEPHTIVIDEAHCISQWGRSFRPSYLSIATTIAQFTYRPTLAAFTATATQQTLADISEYLELRNPAQFIGSQYRPNLHFRIIHVNSYTEQYLFLLQLIRKHLFQSGIIYVSTRAMCEELSDLLNTHFANGKQRFSLPYHGKLSASVRKHTQTKFIHGLVPVIVATTAFGMGVDMPTVRFVIHFHSPSSIEEYIQQTGRAGRDNNVSKCYWLFNRGDLVINKALVSTDLDEKKLSELVELTYLKDCRVKSLISYLGQNDFIHCYNCDICHPDQNHLHPLLKLVSTQEHMKVHQLYYRRKMLAKQLSIKETEVCTDKVLVYLAVVTPKSAQQALNIPGIGTGWIKIFWQSFSDILSE